MSELKDYYFTDKEIDTIFKLINNEAFHMKYNLNKDNSFMNDLANSIHDQIVNHPDND